MMKPSHIGVKGGHLTPFSDSRIIRSLKVHDRVQAYPEVVQGAAKFHPQVADPLLPQADPVFHDATPLDLCRAQQGSRTRARPPTCQGRLRSLTLRQRLTQLRTWSLRSRRWWSSWCATCCSRVSCYSKSR